MKKQLSRWFDDSVRVLLSLLLGLTLIVVACDVKWGMDWRGLLVNANSTIIDVALFGVLVLWLDKRRERRDAHRELCEQLEDFRLWSGEEASYRKSGIIKRLSDSGLPLPRFNGMNMEETTLHGLNLRGALFGEANLNGASLANADLTGANFYHTHCIGTSFVMAKGLTKETISEAVLDRNTTRLPPELFQQGFSWDEYEQTPVAALREQEWKGYTIVRGTEIPPKSEAEVHRLLRQQEKNAINLPDGTQVREGIPLWGFVSVVRQPIEKPAPRSQPSADVPAQPKPPTQGENTDI